MDDSCGLQNMKLGVAPLLIAALLTCGCANLRRSQQEVIYVPTANGMEAQRVSVGPAIASGKTAVPDGPQAVDSEAKRHGVRAALLADSRNLEYLGQISEPIFIKKDTLEASIGSKRHNDYDNGKSICQVWARHVQEILDAGSLVSCTDYSIKGESFLHSRWNNPSIDFHSLTYNFLRLREWCAGDIGGMPLPCEIPPLQDSGPGLLESPLCVVVVAQVFRARDGRRFALIEGTDPAVYGSRRAIRTLTSSERSRQEFSIDFSKINSKDACADFFEEKL